MPSVGTSGVVDSELSTVKDKKRYTHTGIKYVAEIVENSIEAMQKYAKSMAMGKLTWKSYAIQIELNFQHNCYVCISLTTALQR